MEPLIPRPHPKSYPLPLNTPTMEPNTPTMVPRLLPPQPLMVLLMLVLLDNTLLVMMLELLIPTLPCLRRLFPAFPEKIIPSTVRFPSLVLAVMAKSMEVRNFASVEITRKLIER